MDDSTYAFLKDVLIIKSFQLPYSRISMKLSKNNFLMPIMVFVLFGGCHQQQNTNTNSVSEADNIEKTRALIVGIDDQFSRAFFNGDSVALANYYASDAKLGSLSCLETRKR